MTSALRSKEYTKIFVLRKNLSLVHFVPVEVPARVNVPQVFHQPIEALGVSRTLRELREPFAECRIYCPALPARHRARPLDQVSSALKVIFFIRNQCALFSCN